MRRAITHRPPADRSHRPRATPARAIAGVLTAALLTGGLSACGGASDTDNGAASSPTSPAAGSPSPSSAPGPEDPDTTFETVEPVLSPFVTTRVGAKVSRRIIDDAVDVLTNYSYAEEVVTATPPEQMSKLLSLAGSMTASGGRYWRGYVHHHAKANYEQQRSSKVFTLAWWGLISDTRPNKPSPLPEKGPVVINPRFRQVRTSWLDDGRIAVDARVSLDLRFRRDNGKPVMLGATGTHTLRYEYESGQWRLDGWTSQLKFADAYSKDPYAS